jgi:hypothetical protein
MLEDLSRNKCFSRFEYHIFYVLYEFVTYLLTFHHGLKKVYPWRKSPRYQLCSRRLGGLQRWFRRCGKHKNLLPLLGIEHRHHISRSHTDSATPARVVHKFSNTALRSLLKLIKMGLISRKLMTVSHVGFNKICERLMVMCKNPFIALRKEASLWINVIESKDSPTTFGDTLKTKLRCFSPQANYTDRVTAACRRS